MAYMLPYIPLVQVHNYLCILMYTYVLRSTAGVHALTLFLSGTSVSGAWMPRVPPELASADHPVIF